MAKRDLHGVEMKLSQHKCGHFHTGISAYNVNLHVKYGLTEDDMLSKQYLRIWRGTEAK